MATCRSCDAHVVWAKTLDGRNIPLDAEPMGGWDAPRVFPDGNLRPVLSDRRINGHLTVEYVTPGEGKYRTHFSSCPDANEWRRDR
jgi:hypothetical protein